MFRWTAGTKARADRAARLHAVGVGPGRLLLAARPLHAPLVGDAASKAKGPQAATPAKNAATEVVSMPPHADADSTRASHNEQQCQNPAEETGSIQKATEADPPSAEEAGKEENVCHTDGLVGDVLATKSPPSPQEAAASSPPLSRTQEDNGDIGFKSAIEGIIAPADSNAAARRGPSCGRAETLPTSLSHRSSPVQPCAPTCSRSDGDRLVRAMRTAEERGRNDRRRTRTAHRSHLHRGPHRHYRMHTISNGTALLSERACVDDALGDESSSCAESFREADSSSASLGSAGDITDAAVATYDMLPREWWSGVEGKRAHHSADSGTQFVVECLSNSSRQSSSASRQRRRREDGRVLCAKQNNKRRRDEGVLDRARLSAMSVDCVSVQMPLRGQRTAAARRVASDSASLSTSSTLPSQRNCDHHLSHPLACTPEHYSHHASLPSKGETLSGGGVFFPPTARRCGSGEDQNRFTTTEETASVDTALIEVAADTHGRLRNSTGAERDEGDTYDMQAFLAVTPLFHEATGGKPSDLFPPSFHENIAFPSAIHNGADDEHGVLSPYLWHRSVRGDGEAAMQHATVSAFEDYPLGLAPQRMPDSYGRLYFGQEEGPFACESPCAPQQQEIGEHQPFDGAGWAREMPMLPSPIEERSSWVPAPAGVAADAIPPREFEWSTGSQVAKATSTNESFLNQDHLQSKGFFQPFSARAQEGFIAGMWDDGDSVAQPQQVGFTSSSDQGVGYSAPSFARRASEVPNPVTPWMPAAPRHYNIDPQRQLQEGVAAPWAAYPPPPRQQLNAVSTIAVSPFCLPQSSLDFAPQAGNDRGRHGHVLGAAPRGGRQRRRQAPPRALNGTTDRCRRFWERCRSQADAQLPQHPGFFQ